MFYTLIKPSAYFSVNDWIDQCKNYWKPILIDGKKLPAIKDYLYWEKENQKLKKNHYYEFVTKAKKTKSSEHPTIFKSN